MVEMLEVVYFMRKHQISPLCHHWVTGERGLNFAKILKIAPTYLHKTKQLTFYDRYKADSYLYVIGKLLTWAFRQCDKVAYRRHYFLTIFKQSLTMNNSKCNFLTASNTLEDVVLLPGQFYDGPVMSSEVSNF